MVSWYREFPPCHRLRPWVECFWTYCPPRSEARHRVLPDGCVDILFQSGGGGDDELKVVGAMTSYRTHALPGGRRTLGVRFRPGMARPFLKLPICEITDQVIPLAVLWGRAADLLLERLAGARADSRAVQFLEAALVPPSDFSRAQKAVSSLAAGTAAANLADLAHDAGCGSRQFRRLCLAETGLTPKRLARILRFRRALARLRYAGRVEYAALAAESGYYDQSHLIGEFRRLGGLAPGQWRSGAGR